MARIPEPTLQAERARRAQNEYDRAEFVLIHSDEAPALITKTGKSYTGSVVQIASGNTYFVTPDSCTCGDWSKRCAPSTGLECKHQQQVAMWLENGKEMPRSTTREDLLITKMNLIPLDEWDPLPGQYHPLRRSN
jgi:hypothetical protein